MPSSAPTAIHILSLHDALPILPVRMPLPVVTFDAELEGLLAQAVRVGPNAAHPFEPALAQRIIAAVNQAAQPLLGTATRFALVTRSEEHTSELQSRQYLVCRLPRPLRSTFFPYTTLFRSCRCVCPFPSSRSTPSLKACSRRRCGSGRMQRIRSSPRLRNGSSQR